MEPEYSKKNLNLFMKGAGYLLLSAIVEGGREFKLWNWCAHYPCPEKMMRPYYTYSFKIIDRFIEKDLITVTKEFHRKAHVILATEKGIRLHCLLKKVRGLIENGKANKPD